MTLNLDDLEALYLNDKERPTGTIGRDHVLALITRLREAERERDGARWAAGIVGDVARESSGGWQGASAELHATQARLREAERHNVQLLDEAVKAWGRALNAEAVISEALNHDPLHGRKEGMHCGGMAPCIRETLTAHEPWNYEK